MFVCSTRVTLFTCPLGLHTLTRRMLIVCRWWHATVNTKRGFTTAVSSQTTENVGRQEELNDVATNLEETLKRTSEYASSGFLMYRLGMVRRDQARFEEALHWLEKVAMLSPGHPDIHFEVGIVLEQLGRTTESMAAVGRAKKAGFAPRYAHQHTMIGRFHLEQGEKELALWSFRAALQTAAETEELMDHVDAVEWTVEAMEFHISACPIIENAHAILGKQIYTDWYYADLGQRMDYVYNLTKCTFRKP